MRDGLIGPDLPFLLCDRSSGKEIRIIHDLVIQHFRCHRDITMAGLGQINLLTGMNNTGKSVALEALLLLSLAHSPRLAFERLRLLRGYSQSFKDQDLGNSLFHNWKTEHSMLIAALEDAADINTEKTARRTLEITAGFQKQFAPVGRGEFDVDEHMDLSETLDQYRDFRFALKTPNGDNLESWLFDVEKNPEAIKGRDFLHS